MESERKSLDEKSMLEGGAMLRVLRDELVLRFWRRLRIVSSNGSFVFIFGEFNED